MSISWCMSYTVSAAHQALVFLVFFPLCFKLLCAGCLFHLIRQSGSCGLKGKLSWICFSSKLRQQFVLRPPPLPVLFLTCPSCLLAKRIQRSARVVLILPVYELGPHLAFSSLLKYFQSKFVAAVLVFNVLLVFIWVIRVGVFFGKPCRPDLVPGSSDLWVRRTIDKDSS
jgi:hypothetical protein